MKLAFLVCVAVAIVATNISAKEATPAERKAWLNDLLKERRVLAQEFWNRWGKLERSFWSRWVLSEENYLQKLFGTASNATTSRPALPAVRKSNLTLVRRNNLGALKKRADAKRILAIQKALASRKNGTATGLPVRNNNVTMLRQRFLSSKNITLTVLPKQGNATLRFAHLPTANGTRRASNATVPLVKLAPLNATKAAVKGAPAVKAPVVKLANLPVKNMTEAQLAARRKAVLAKFAQAAQKPAVNGTAKAVKKK